MSAPNTGLRGMWVSPERTGMRLLIAPWEYRHLRAWVRVRAVAGIVAVALGFVTLVFGGNDWKTYGWSLVFLGVGVANWAFAYWELRIIRSQDSERR